MEYFLQGLTMGLAYVAPVGVQNLFVINSALVNSCSRALLTALIVIFFDVSLALACFFGIGAVMEHYVWLQAIILLAGSFIVIAIGVNLLRSRVTTLGQGENAASVRKTITSACVVTWFNPQAILDGTMMLGAFRTTLPAAQAITFISGVAIASCLWFVGLTLFISLCSSKFTIGVMQAINRICGIVIIFYGVKLLLSFTNMIS